MLISYHTWHETVDEESYLVLVSIHASQSADVCKDVLYSIGELECIDVSKAVLHMGINNKLGQPKDFTAQMEGISESRLLSLLGR